MRVLWEICVKGISDTSIFLLPPSCALSYHVQLFSPSILWWVIFPWAGQSILPQSYPCTIRGMSSGNHYSVSPSHLLGFGLPPLMRLFAVWGSHVVIETGCFSGLSAVWSPLLIFSCVLNTADLTVCPTNLFTEERDYKSEGFTNCKTSSLVL